MEKILRLSWANIRKRKLETVSLLILVMLCMLLMGSSLAGVFGIRNIFPQMMEHTGSYENFILLSAKYYDDEFEHILRSYDSVEEVAHANMLFSYGTNYLDADGKEQAQYLGFITHDDAMKIEKAELESTLSEAELAAIEHPVWMPYAAQITLHYRCGDHYDVIYGSRKYAFTVAGFYDTMLYDTPESALKLIVSDQDYRTLQSVLDEYDVLAYNDHQGQGGTQLMDDFTKACEDYSNNDIRSGLFRWYYDAFRLNTTFTLGFLLAIIIAMAAIIVLSVAFMIRFRIAADIKEQIVSIGVLEALGYTSKEIVLSYMAEYLLIAAAGCIPGFLGCFALTPFLLSLGETMVGHYISHSVCVPALPLTVAGILLLVAGIAFLRAGAVRHYPPVRALRKGQGDHRFGKEHLPLRNTKSNVHLRLAMKGFLQNFRQSIGLTLCISVASAAVVFSFILFLFFGFNMNAIANNAGIEMSDLQIQLMPGEDAKAFAEELLAEPEVRKATPTTVEDMTLQLPDYNEMGFSMVFEDFGVTENIHPMDGRFPEHDNEAMITVMMAKLMKLRTGDTVTLEYLHVKRQYLITGLVTSTTNGGANIYLTEEAMKRLYPNYRPSTVEVYLEDGVDAEAYRRQLTQRYGRSLADAAQDKTESGSYEERIRAEAERQIAELMGTYGVSHVEYAIQVGDEMITGNSSNFRIKSILNLGSILQTQLGSLSTAITAATVAFSLIAAIVVMIILFILMESTVRKSRRELGIMKGMGYTSKELMLQLAFRIMPSALFSVVIGNVIAVACTGFLTGYIGRVGINYPAVILVDTVILLFCFICSYIGARKIKKISVYELMTE